MNFETKVSIKSLIHENQRMPGFPRLADFIISNPESMAELVGLAISDEEYPYPQYASWLLLHVARKNNLLVEPFYNQVIDGILTTRNTSALRSLLGASLCLPLKEYEQGRFLDRLFVLINDTDTKPGLINYSVRKLAEFIEMYPELLHELELILKFREEMKVSPGIVIWSKTVLKKRRIKFVKA